MHRTILRLAMITSLLAAALPAKAQDVVFKNSGTKSTLIELYSSEGCSSCPPAETWISNLKISPDLWSQLFPVVFHVDYWDGLGWPDRFAKPAYTSRQRDYAAQLKQDSVYTPEFVTSGREWRGWFHGEGLPAPEQGTSGELALTVMEGGKKVSANYSPAAQAGTQVYTLNVALLGVGVMSNVESGENSGRHLQHDFVVLDFQSKAMEKGQVFQSGPVELKPATLDSPGAVVAWVSAADGSIVQVVGGWLKPSP